MNVFLLMVALTAPVEAPKAGLQEAAAATAAVASVEILPTVNAVSAVETTPPQVSVIRGVEMTPPRTETSQWGEDVPPAQIVKGTIPPQIGIWAAAKPDTDSNPCEVYRRRPLSGPWSVTRRLNAARLRGDEDEVERLTALLGNAVEEALEAEGAEP